MSSYSLNAPGRHSLDQAMQQTAADPLGRFKIGPRHALTLAIPTPGELRITHGQVWLTLANAAQDASVRAGDHFLSSGTAMRLAGGQKVVVEALDALPDAAVYVSWVPDGALSTTPVSWPRPVQRSGEVRQPLIDLGTALQQAAGAFGRLLQAVAGSLACSLMMRRRT